MRITLPSITEQNWEWLPRPAFFSLQLLNDDTTALGSDTSWYASNDSLWGAQTALEESTFRQPSMKRQRFGR